MVSLSRQSLANKLTKVREIRPLVHTIMNPVASNFTANGLLALGASPVMAHAPQEVADMVKHADALVLNLGMIHESAGEAMLIAGKTASKKGIPVILDPVGVGATAYRTQWAKRVLQEVKVAVVRGNAAEVANLIDQNEMIKGVDLVEETGDVLLLAKRAAQKLSCLVVITGKVDVVSDGLSTFVVRNGHPILTRVTGTGCLLAAVIGAFSATCEELAESSIAALGFYGVAAELAVDIVGPMKPGSFQIEFINQLALLTESIFIERVLVEKFS